jgi:hypothetical protein
VEDRVQDEQVLVDRAWRQPGLLDERVAVAVDHLGGDVSEPQRAEGGDQRALDDVAVVGQRARAAARSTST